MGLDAMIFIFRVLSFKPALLLSSFTLIKRLFSSFLPREWCHLCMWGYWYFSQQSWLHLWLVQPGILHDILFVSEKAVAPHSTTLAWKILWTEEPGRLQSMRSLELDTTERLHFHFSLSCIGEGNGNPLQCSCLENPRDCGAWWAAVYGVAQSQTRLKRLSNSSNSLFRASQVAQWVKNLPAMKETQAKVSLIPGIWKIPWRKAWQPTPVFLPAESHGQSSLVSCSP